MDALTVKQRLVGTRVGDLGLRVQWASRAGKRIRHPELWDLYLEDMRFQEVLRHLIKPTWNCVDAGAHIGSVLSQFVRRAPNGKHVAIEPDADKAKNLAKRFLGVEVLQVALSDHEGEAKFFANSDHPGYSGLSPSDGRSTVTSVPVSRLDSCLTNRVDFIKMDIEGGELPALQGARRVLTEYQPPLLFECGLDESLKPYGYTRADLYAFVTGVPGYQIFSLKDFLYGRAPMCLDEFLKAGTYPFPGFNYLALPLGVEVARRMA